MKLTKRILQWLVGIVVGLYLATLLLVNIPFVQRWLANGVEGILEDVLDTRVEIGKVSLGLSGTVIVDDLDVWDLQDEKMLHVARLGARVNVRDFLKKRIRIGNARIFGLHANLYQPCEECDPNFKFLLDAFASKDTTRHTPLDLKISQVLVRRGRIKWEQRWKNNPLELSDLNMTAQLNCLTDDSLNLRVKRFDAKEKGGLCVNALTFHLTGNKKQATLSDLKLQMPNSMLDVPSLNTHFIKENGKLKLGQYAGQIKGYLSPSDFVSLLPQLAEVRNTADLDIEFDGKDDSINIRHLRIVDHNGDARLQANGHAEGLKQGKDNIRATLNLQDLYVRSNALRPYVSTDLLNRLDNLSAQGQLSYNQGLISSDINAQTSVGSATVQGSGRLDGTLKAKVYSDGLELGKILQQPDIGTVSFDVEANGTLTNNPNLTLTGRIPELVYKGYRYRNINVHQLSIHDSRITADISSADPNAMLSAEGDVNLNAHTYKVQADIARLMPNTLNLTDKYAGQEFSGKLFADLKGAQWTKIEGIAQLNEFTLTDSTGSYRPGDIHFTSRPKGQGGNMMLISPFLEAQVEGNINPKLLVDQIKHMVSKYLPTEQSKSISPYSRWENSAVAESGNTNPHSVVNNPNRTSGDSFSFILRAYNAQPLQKLLGIPLTLNGTTAAYGEIDSEQNALWVNLSAPSVTYGHEQLHNIDLHLESNFESMVANLGMQRFMKGKWINIGLDTQGFDGKLTTRVFFNNDNAQAYEELSRRYSGEINVVSQLWRDVEGRQGFYGEIKPSDFIISDTIWSVHHGSLSYYDGVLRVDSFQVSQGQDRFVKIDGRASKLESDTLHATLQRINLEYIFSLINFHAVELTGEATGDAYAHSLLSSPKADAYIHIPQFALNYGTLGDLNIHINWGNRPYSIFLDGIIHDNNVTPPSSFFTQNPLPDGSSPVTLVNGYITPKKDIEYHGIDLNVKAQYANMEFLNKWTSAIFDDLQGRATGWVHIFGPFKQINIEGDAIVNEGSLGIPYIGVRYHLENDSVLLRPDNIYFTDATIYDPQGNPGIEGHQAKVNGHLHHNNFKNLSFDILIRGENILGYNFTDFGDQNFYGTVLASGDVTLKGHPGQVRIGIKAHPERGTSFTYNATSPDKLTDTPFITYIDRSLQQYDVQAPATQNTATGSEQETTPSSDLYIDFDLDIDEQSTMNLLMDARSGDKISLRGAGHMLAHYYDKGSFDLFGTYRVNRGTYNLSLQEVIHKNFEFSPDGTITFNGEPYDADLNLQAIHTVSGVSLNDINPKANFSNTTTRVNCLMNIGGKARSPRITFDFDIPNANEEEKQMVRSLISTEEERNMQVIYLLGIGRFYAYDYANDSQTQGTMAMNSLLSSTLSSTINQALSNMIGSPNWNFGANLRTGEEGWSNMDVEGMLQGNLLNNRLLINGNFGYRDNPVQTSNFIGDFDVKYLLTRTGTVALKAYSETNDRYFTKSSLTTQGIGILLKKDFTSWRNLVVKRKKK